MVDGGTLIASGIVSGPLAIEDGGEVAASGTISGDVSLAAGGVLDVTGILGGRVLRNDGDLTAAVGAVIHGRRLTDGGGLVPTHVGSGTITITEATQRFRLTGTGSNLAVDGAAATDQAQ